MSKLCITYNIGSLELMRFGHSAYLTAAAFLSRLRLACWLHWTCTIYHLKYKKL